MLLAQEQVRLLEHQRVANITSDRVHSSVDVMVPRGWPGVFLSLGAWSISVLSRLAGLHRGVAPLH